MSEQVKAGQIWIDNDPRMKDPRELLVKIVGSDHVVVENVRTQRRTIIALKRFKPTSTGYRLKALSPEREEPPSK